MTSNIDSFLLRLPKVELHLHLEGTLESDLLFSLAKRNNIKSKFNDAEERRQACEKFHDLQSFLDIYEDDLRVLITADDFEDLAWAYFQRAAKDNVRHCEFFLDIQAHLSRGISLQCQFDGIRRARQRAETELNMTTALLISFLRDQTEADALNAFEQALNYRDHFIGIGLDSAESKHPPNKFTLLYQRAHELGLHCVAHAGEEGPASYVQEAIDVLKVERIDHGIHAADDPLLLDTIARAQLPLTICPLSNLKLRVVRRIDDLPLKLCLEKGVKITLNSDDPAYFGGYILKNFQVVQDAFQFSKQDWIRLTRNAIEAAFISNERREQLFKELDFVCSI